MKKYNELEARPATGWREAWLLQIIQIPRDSRAAASTAGGDGGREKKARVDLNPGVDEGFADSACRGLGGFRRVRVERKRGRGGWGGREG